MSLQESLQSPPTTINDRHKKWDVTSCIIVLLLISVLATGSRLLVRWKTKKFGLDDWVMVPALIGYIGHSIMGAYANARGGIGKPLWEVTLPEFEIWLKIMTFSCFLYPLTSGLIRISILLFYDRIFSITNRSMRLAIRITLGLTISYIVVLNVYAALLCRPLHKLWAPFERHQYCGDDIIKWIFDATVYGYSLVLDIVLVLLPLFPLLTSQICMHKKIGAIFMFALGTSACVAATYKLVVFGLQWGRIGNIDHRWRAQQLSIVIPPQFDTYGYTMWIPTQTELSAAMIGTSLVSVRQYLQQSLPSSGFTLTWLRTSFISRSQVPDQPSYLPSFSRNELHPIGASKSLRTKNGGAIEMLE